MTNVRLAQLKSIKKLFVLFKLETLLWHATPTIFKKTAFFERLVATTGLHIYVYRITVNFAYFISQMKKMNVSTALKWTLPFFLKILI